MRRVVVGAVATLLLVSGCTGVRDEKGWDKAVKRGYPCSELLDIAEDLPSSVDPRKVADDLRRAGCEPPAAPIG
jgi:hypothetical protein